MNRSRLLVTLALVAACSERVSGADEGDEPCAEVEPLGEAGCVEIRAELELMGKRVEGATLGGFVLMSSEDRLIVARIGVDDQIEELATIEGGSGDGLIAREPHGHTLGVLEQPDRLHAFDLDGNLLSSAELGAPQIARTWALALHEGDLIRVYSVDVGSPDLPAWELYLERRGLEGQPRWTWAVDSFELGEFEIDSVRDLGVRDGLISLLAFDGHLDSSAVELVAIDPELGELRWHRRLADDDFGGPAFALAGEPGPTLLATLHPRVYADMGPAAPAHVILSRLDDGGETQWERRVDLDELENGLAVELVRFGDDMLVHVVNWAVVRIPTSEPPCWEPLADGALYDALDQANLRAIGGGRALLDVVVPSGDNVASRTLVLGDGVGGCIDI